MIVLVFVMFISFHFFTSYSQFQSYINTPWYRRNDELDLDKTYFNRLESYQVNASGATEAEYPWIARVIHSRLNAVPYLCTASCVDKYIFVTTARCVFLLKIKYTTILYKNERLTVKALVNPSQESKHLFDDVGFIIVNNVSINKWDTVKVFNKRRTDKKFQWFNDMELDKNDYHVVGYAREKNLNAYPLWLYEYKLTKLKVIMDMNICPHLLQYSSEVVAFKVPCYYSCSIENFKDHYPNCTYYHGVEGGAVINTQSKELMALATWGFYFTSLELPVGVAMANSDNYFEEYTCAKIIRDNKQKPVTAGFYQSLCN